MPSATTDYLWVGLCSAGTGGEGRASPRRCETVGPCHRPGLTKARVAGAVDQFARAQRRIEFCECLHLGGGGSLREMDRAQLSRMFKPGGGEEFGQRVQGGVMVVVDPLDLVRHNQGASAGWILRGHAGRAPIG